MGGGGGKGGGKGGGGGAQISPEMEDLILRQSALADEQYELGFPLFERGTQQGLDTLTQGYTDALLPGIKTALEQTRSAGSQQMTSARENATRAGLTGTALTEQLARSGLGAESQAASVPGQFTLPLQQQTIDPVFGLMGQGIQGTGTAGQFGSGVASPMPNQTAGALGGAMSGAKMGSSIMPGWGTLIGAGAGALMGSRGAQ